MKKELPKSQSKADKDAFSLNHIVQYNIMHLHFINSRHNNSNKKHLQL